MGDDKQLATQRDIFVFQCMIGCRVSDLYKMTYANIIGDCIEYVPRKTRDDRVVTVSVPLIDAAKELIRKYLDETRGTLFPFISEQKYNVYIKAAMNSDQYFHRRLRLIVASVLVFFLIVLFCVMVSRGFPFWMAFVLLVPAGLCVAGLYYFSMGTSADLSERFFRRFRRE